MLFSLKLFSVVIAAAHASWSPARLHHVDSIGPAHLFRGPAPVSNGSFVFDELRSQMQTMGQKEGNITIPDEFTLVVISMLNTLKSSEAAELKVEEDYFDGLSGSRLIKWPIIGDVTSPSIYPKSLCRSEAKKIDSEHDHMVTKIKTLRLLLTNATSPTVVYFHCDAGMDRTGEMYGDYQMTYANQTYHEVYDFDNSIEGPGGRSINKVNKQALEWMCIYLFEVKGLNPACNMCM